MTETKYFVYKYVYEGKPIYIGKTTNLKERLDTHRRGKDLDAKFKKYANKSEICYYECANRCEMDGLELLLINKHNPILNVSGKYIKKSQDLIIEPEWKRYVESSFCGSPGKTSKPNDDYVWIRSRVKEREYREELQRVKEMKELYFFCLNHKKEKEAIMSEPEGNGLYLRVIAEFKFKDKEGLRTSYSISLANSYTRTENGELIVRLKFGDETYKFLKLIRKEHNKRRKKLKKYKIHPNFADRAEISIKKHIPKIKKKHEKQFEKGELISTKEELETFIEKHHA